MKPTSFTLPLTWSSPSGSALGWGGGGRWGHTAGRLAAHLASPLPPPAGRSPGPSTGRCPPDSVSLLLTLPGQRLLLSSREIFNQDNVGIKSNPSPGARCPLPPSPAQPSWVSSPLLPMSQARGGPLPGAAAQPSSTQTPLSLALQDSVLSSQNHPTPCIGQRPPPGLSSPSPRPACPLRIT